MVTEEIEELDANSLGMIAWVTRMNWLDEDETRGIGILGHEVRVLGLRQEWAAAGSRADGPLVDKGNKVVTLVSLMMSNSSTMIQRGQGQRVKVR